MLTLMTPTMAHEAQVMAIRAGFLARGEGIHGGAMLQEYEQYADWLRQLRLNAREDTVRLGFVPATTLIAVREDDQKVIGFIDIRHRLNDFLLKTGGHIGYAVVPDERRKGYAKAMLKQALRICATLGIERVLVACDARNEASRRTILSQGGQLENVVQKDDGAAMERYWITLPFTVRPAAIGDAEALHRINREALSYDYPLDKTVKRLRLLLDSGRDRLFMAVRDGEVIGYAHAADYECTYVDSLKNLLALAVLPAWQGHGIGRALLDAVERWALSDGSAGVRLVSGYNRHGAHSFYRACGYAMRKEQLNFIKWFQPLEGRS